MFYLLPKNAEIYLSNSSQQAATMLNSFILKHVKCLFLLPLLPTAAWSAASVPIRDQVALMESEKLLSITGIARKTRDVDARPAVPGEIIVTIIKNEGVETRSKPAEPGDWVVRNRCEETGNEEILVKAAKFSQRYGATLSKPDDKGYQAFKPSGSDMNYFIVPEKLGAFEFIAPWGEKMVARPGDAIIQTSVDAKDTYRVAAGAFRCIYEIVSPAKD